MGLLTWLVDRIGSEPNETFNITDEEFFNIQTSLYIRNLAFYSAVNLIANAVSKCEFKTYFKFKEVKEREWYLLNIEPNKNQNSSEFVQKLIHKLFSKNECLIIEQNGNLLIADSYNMESYALYDNRFKDVEVGELKFKKTFYMSDVLYFRLNNEDIRKLVNGMYEEYGTLITYAQKSYKKSRGQRGILKVDSLAFKSDPNKPDFHTTFEDLMNTRFKKFFENENAVLPLFDGYSYNDIGSKTYSNEGTRDIRAMVDDIYDMTARAFQIPPAILKGDVAGNSDLVDSLLTFAVDPVIDLVETEFNRKRSGYKLYSQGTYIKIYSKTIKHIDLLSVASSIDKLISSGAFCINDIRIAVGEQPIDEEWAYKHFITKNYSDIEEAIKSMMIERGETSEE